ncbi:Uncharacterised protein [uncultured Clostridium sp.]|uniref:hypothetical protein n=1 Tax=uncultured Clostridium sp. TaxID=59620 RepID=UPI000822A7F2|nr:hypothetical protein [uncultured Clostridium sp.]SCI98641.1 Uncharacterised protein [uncultured Clostridium sp.]
MEKYISKFLVMICVAIAAISYPIVAEAAVETFTISNYSESFVPAENNDAILNIEMTAKTSDEGIIYIPVSVEESEVISASIDGKEVTTELTKVGNVSYFTINSGMPETEVNVRAEISCKDFYAVDNNDPDTGIPTSLMEYKFTNKSPNKIESYNLTIALPNGMEPISVMTPSDVTKYTLSENEEGQRTLSLKGGVAVSGSSTFKFTFGTPFTSNTIAVVIIWVIVIGISAYVLKERLREEK